jgi:hypothetical protein
MDVRLYTDRLLRDARDRRKRAPIRDLIIEL